MKFVFESSLKKSAKAALRKGDGKHGKWAVDGNHIALIGKDGRPMDWVLIVRSVGPVITAQD